MHPPQTKTKQTFPPLSSVPSWENSSSSPGFPFVSGCSMSVKSLMQPEPWIHRKNHGFSVRKLWLDVMKPQWFNNLRFNSVSQFHFKEILAELVGNNPIAYTVSEWWMSNCYGSVNPLLTYLLKTPCCAFNLKIMDWVLPKHWFTGRIMKVKSQFPL